MKPKKIKISSGIIIALLIIFAYEEYQDYKLKQESKCGKILENSIENFDLDNVFIPVNDDLDEKSSNKKGK